MGNSTEEPLDLISSHPYSVDSPCCMYIDLDFVASLKSH